MNKNNSIAICPRLDYENRGFCPKSTPLNLDFEVIRLRLTRQINPSEVSKIIFDLGWNTKGFRTFDISVSTEGNIKFSFQSLNKESTKEVFLQKLNTELEKSFLNHAIR